MKRIQLLTVGVVACAAMAVFDLISGWTGHAGFVGVAVALCIFAVAIALYVAMLVFGVRERRQEAGVGTAAAGIRWGATFAIAFAVLLFTNCSSVITSDATPHALVVAQDARAFLGLSGWVVVPLLLSLALPAGLVTAAAVQARRGRSAAVRLVRLATWASGAVVLVVLGTAIGGFYAAISTCAFGGTVGYCAVGLASLTNLFSLGALALLLPYVALAGKALDRQESAS